MGYIFVSYSSKDREFVRRLADDLTKNGHELWLDFQKITGRKPYWQEIQDGIESCTHFLFVVSPESIVQDSGSITELYHVGGLKPLPVIVPVLLYDVPLKKLPILISPGRYQIHDFAHQPYEVALPSVLKALEATQHNQSAPDGEVKAAKTSESADVNWSPPTLKEMMAAEKPKIEEPQRNDYNAPTRPVITSLAQLEAQRSGSQPVAASFPKPKQKIPRSTFYIIGAVLVLSLGAGLLAALLPGAFGSALPPTKTVVAQAQFSSTPTTTPTELLTETPTGTATPSPIPTWNPDPVEVFDEHTKSIVSVAFSPDSRYAASASADKTIKLWDLTSGSTQSIMTFSGSADTVTSVVFTPDGKYLLSGSSDHSVRLWDVKTGNERHRYSGSVFVVTCVAISPDGKEVLAGGWDKMAHLWQIGQTENPTNFTGHTDVVYSVDFSPDGKYVLTGSFDQTAKLWDINGQEIRTFTGHANAVLAAIFSPDGTKMVTGSKDKTAELWDVQSGNSLQIFTGHTDSITSVAFSPDGKYVLTGSEDSTARLWDISTGQEVRRFAGHLKGVTSVAFSPDGKYVLTGSEDNTLRLWDSGLR